jgi:alpha-galactosidase
MDAGRQRSLGPRALLAALLAGIAILIAPAAALAASARAHEGMLAATPPMGWNSWDAYGLTIDESQFRANAAVLAGLARDGWRYAVIDEGWYMENPLGRNREERRYVLDGQGLLIPAPARFASSAGGSGFRPLADWLHARGLQLGLHIVRGIPKQAVVLNLPIAGSSHRAAEAASTTDLCPWDDGNYGIADNAAGQAYYDAMLRRFAQWGVDLIKVDCIADHPYRPSEIRQIATAIRRSGRPIVLSLSPGPTQLSHAGEVARYAQVWRIANDLWDGWTFAHRHRGDDFPNGVRSAFDSLARWSSYAGPGHWPDADMLPFGSLLPRPGWGEPRETRLTREEERSALTLWAVARSPLILGGNLTQLDAFTRSLITNRALIEVNQTARSARPLTGLALDPQRVRVWIASVPWRGRDTSVIAVFNLEDGPQAFRAGWPELGISSPAQRIRDLWSGRVAAGVDGLDLKLPPHGCAIYRLE